MTVPRATRALLVNTAELRRQPGSRRRIDRDVSAAELDVGDQRVTGDVTVELAVESTLDGIVVTGSVRVPWADECRRCLRPIEGIAVAAADELYQEAVTDPDAFAMEADRLDLAAMVRELVLLELPDAPLCRDDCAGICPVCGRDRNADPCDCDATVRDERWAALDDLDLD